MKPLRIALLAVLLIAAPAFAGIYTWTDKDGTIHMTDSMEKVPQEYRGKAVGREDTELQDEPAGERHREGAAAEEQAEPQQGVELYGDYTLEWWKESFRKLIIDIDRVDKGLEDKKQFVRFFEIGLKSAAIFDQKDVNTYEQYKIEIPGDEARLAALKDEQTELRRKARILGVPKDIRGE